MLKEKICEWWLDNKLHRENGPAVVYREEEYWLNGIHRTFTIQADKKRKIDVLNDTKEVMILRRRKKIK